MPSLHAGELKLTGWSTMGETSATQGPWQARNLPPC